MQCKPRSVWVCLVHAGALVKRSRLSAAAGVQSWVLVVPVWLVPALQGSDCPEVVTQGAVMSTHPAPSEVCWMED